MKKQQEDNLNKNPQETGSIPFCGDFRKMAEMMKTCCPGNDGAIDCCSMMRKMMGKGKDSKTEETKKGERTKSGESD